MSRTNRWMRIILVAYALVALAMPLMTILGPATEGS